MFSIERSGYYAWTKRKPSKQSIANEALDKKIIDIFNSHSSRYGYPRITDELHDQGEKCGKKSRISSDAQARIASKRKEKIQGNN